MVCHGSCQRGLRVQKVVRRGQDVQLPLCERRHTVHHAEHLCHLVRENYRRLVSGPVGCKGLGLDEKGISADARVGESGLDIYALGTYKGHGTPQEVSVQERWSA